jgi:hypothetical protein
MDNDILINQARNLYAVLEVRQHTWGIGQSDRLNYLVISAYCRYQRRLNRCVLCYQTRETECHREILGKFCSSNHSNQDIENNPVLNLLQCQLGRSLL